MSLVRREDGVHGTVKTGVTVFSRLQARRPSYWRGAVAERLVGPPPREWTGGRTPAATASRLSSIFSCAVVAALFFNQRHCEKGLYGLCAVLFHASSSTTKNTFHLLCIERRGEQGRVFTLDSLRKI